MPISAIDSITSAFEHTKQQLFRPFRFAEWTRLAFVGLLAGELGSGGGCNFQIPNSGNTQRHYLAAHPHWDPALLVPLIVVAVIVLPILWLVLIYINSRMRFVLFDSVVEKRCEIGRMWQQRSVPALHYFAWQIAFAIASIAGFVLFVGVPVLIAYLLGWFAAPREHIAGLVLGGLAVFFVFMTWFCLVALAHVFTKDFVVPQMALEGVSAFAAWKRLLPMINSERGRYAGYAGMKIVLAIGAAFIIGIAVLVLVLLLLIPIGGLGFISVILARGAGVTWNVYTITFAIVAGCIALLLLLYLVSLVSVPVIVFFPAYSVHFFAARYTRLSEILYPAPPLPPPTPAPVPPL